jgi:hypothetical protein
VRAKVKAAYGVDISDKGILEQITEPGARLPGVLGYPPTQRVRSR